MVVLSCGCLVLSCPGLYCVVLFCIVLWSSCPVVVLSLVYLAISSSFVVVLSCPKSRLVLSRLVFSCLVLWLSCLFFVVSCLVDVLRLPCPVLCCAFSSCLEVVLSCGCLALSDPVLSRLVLSCLVFTGLIFACLVLSCESICGD